MRIRHLCCHIELELSIIVYNGISEVNLFSTMLSSEYLIEKNRLKCWLNLFTHVFYQKLETILDAILHCLNHVSWSIPSDFQLSYFLNVLLFFHDKNVFITVHSLNPSCCLLLRINHKRSSCSIFHQYAIGYWNWIRW
jgi:hypothetical protein